MPSRIGRRSKSKNSEFGANGTGDCGVERARLPARIHEVVSSRRFLAKSCTSVRGLLAIGIGGHFPHFRVGIFLRVTHRHPKSTAQDLKAVPDTANWVSPVYY